MAIEKIQKVTWKDNRNNLEVTIIGDKVTVSAIKNRVAQRDDDGPFECDLDTWREILKELEQATPKGKVWRGDSGR